MSPGGRRWPSSSWAAERADCCRSCLLGWGECWASRGWAAAVVSALPKETSAAPGTSGATSQEADAAG